MAALPRLPPRVEHLLLKRVLGLSPRLQRRLFGPPPKVDGQVLASDINALLELAATAGDTSFTGGLPPAEARAHNRRGAEASTAQPPIPMARVEAIAVPGQAGPIAARFYVPGGLPAGRHRRCSSTSTAAAG